MSRQFDNVSWTLETVVRSLYSSLFISTHFLTLPRELRDQIIEHVLQSFTHTNPISNDSNAALSNPLLVVCKQLRAEILQRISSLELSPTLEVLCKSVEKSRAEWTIPPTMVQKGAVCQRVDINFRYLEPTTYGHKEIYSHRSSKIFNLAAILTFAIVGIQRTGYCTIENLLINLFIPPRESCIYHLKRVHNFNHVLCSVLAPVLLQDSMYPGIVGRGWEPESRGAGSELFECLKMVTLMNHGRLKARFDGRRRA